MLYTNLDLGKEFYSGTVSNFKRIIKNFDVINRKINSHINKNGISHKAQQIAYNNTTVYNELNRQKGKMEGLVVGANGDGISEVKEARIDINGDYH
ncbi:MAG: peptidase G2, partial [Staphylococcus equorum]|nr:peptidase G2 [Staphylococcus equorum]